MRVYESNGKASRPVKGVADTDIEKQQESTTEKGISRLKRSKRHSAELDVTQLYLNEIGYSPLLTADEEVYYSRLARKGDEAGRKREELEKKYDAEHLANDAAQKLRQKLEKKFRRASNSKKKFELAKAEIEAARLHAEYARREHKALNGK